MRINGSDIALYQARQLRVTIGHQEIKNNHSWAPGSGVPYFAPNQYGFKRFQVVLMVKGEGREEIKLNCSRILSLIQGKTKLELDGFQTTFVGVLSAAPTREERSRKKWHTLTLDFDGYEYLTPVVISGTGEVEVNSPGTIESPAIVTLTSEVRVNPVRLTGLCHDHYLGSDLPVTIEDMEANTPIVIDGVTGLITQGGSARDIDAWTLPSFLPGKTRVTCDSTYVNIHIIVYPLIG